MFTYDVKIKQNSNTFLNNHFTYLIPEVRDNFILNLYSNLIIYNSIFKIIYLVGNYQNNINNILTCATDDFVYEFIVLKYFYRWISHHIYFNKYDSADA